MKVRRAVITRGIALALAGIVMGSLLLTPAGAHVGGTVGHLWNHLRPKAKQIFYTKSQVNTHSTVIAANCPPSHDFTGAAYTKIGNIGSFQKRRAGSKVEVTFNGRIRVETFASATGAHFELRVDNSTGLGNRARSSFRSAEAGSNVPVTITGIFTGLSKGTHTVSLWVRAAQAGGSGTDAQWDSGCWSDDYVVVHEYT